MRAFRRFLPLLGLSLGSAVLAADAVVGEARLPVPNGWSIAERTSDRVTLKNASRTQFITLSSLVFGTIPSIEDFKLLCRHRMDSERKGAPDVFIEEGEPARSNGALVFLFSGGERQSRRIFSGQLLLVGKQLTTTYLESSGIDPKSHLALFSDLVGSLKVSTK
jgi:hypothetical protein